MYINTVVIQHHSIVMTKTDKIYKIRCTYDMTSKNITFGMLPIRYVALIIPSVQWHLALAIITLYWCNYIVQKMLFNKQITDSLCRLHQKVLKPKDTAYSKHSNVYRCQTCSLKTYSRILKYFGGQVHQFDKVFVGVKDTSRSSFMMLVVARLFCTMSPG